MWLKDPVIMIYLMVEKQGKGELERILDFAHASLFRSILNWCRQVKEIAAFLMPYFYIQINGNAHTLCHWQHTPYNPTFLILSRTPSCPRMGNPTIRNLTTPVEQRCHAQNAQRFFSYKEYSITPMSTPDPCTMTSSSCSQSSFIILTSEKKNPVSKKEINVRKKVCKPRRASRKSEAKREQRGKTTRKKMKCKGRKSSELLKQMSVLIVVVAGPVLLLLFWVAVELTWITDTTSNWRYIRCLNVLSG